MSKLIDTLVVFKISSTCNQPAQLQRLSIILNILKVANEFVLYYIEAETKKCADLLVDLLELMVYDPVNIFQLILVCTI